MLIQFALHFFFATSRFSHGNQLDVMMVWMWDGLDCQILMFMKESFLAAHIIKAVLEYGL